MDWSPLILTLELALCTTAVLLIIGVPLARWLAATRSPLRPVLETLVSMPLVLPPTVIGFYLLLAFSPNSGPGAWLQDTFGLQLAFSFGGLVIGSVIYSLPFMVHPLQSGFARLPSSLSEASFVLGKSPWETFWRVQIPNIRPALLTAIVLSFAHTIGEFGVVLMIGGSIPDSTRVASIAIYDEVEALNFAAAHTYSFVLLILTFSILLPVYLLNGNFIRRWGK